MRRRMKRTLTGILWARRVKHIRAASSLIPPISNNTVPGFVITYPRSVELAPSIKASRVLSLGFTARLAGAIHVVEITGALAYEL